MSAKYPLVVFAANGGASCVVHLSPSEISLPMHTPMPAAQADGRLAPPWRWGGHRVDLQAQVVHFTFVNRSSGEVWTADVLFERSRQTVASSQVSSE